MIWRMILGRRDPDVYLVIASWRGDMWIRRMLNGSHFSREFTKHALRCAAAIR